MSEAGEGPVQSAPRNASISELASDTPVDFNRADLHGSSRRGRRDARGARDRAISVISRVQAQYDVQYHTYWFDPDAGTVFCLMEGPSREAVDAVHREAHDASASVIIELPQGMPLEHLLGTLPTHADDRADNHARHPRDRVHRYARGRLLKHINLGDDGHVAVLREHDRIVRYELAVHRGREIKHTGDGIMAAFTSVASAVAFAIDVQRGVHARNDGASIPLEVSIGISAGEPVTDGSGDLFGAAVQLAARSVRGGCAGRHHRVVGCA